MSNRPDLDNAISILQNGGFKITGGKYAHTNRLESPMSNTPEDTELRKKIVVLLFNASNRKEKTTIGQSVDDFVNLITLHTNEAYKRGYIAGSIDIVNKQAREVI